MRPFKEGKVLYCLSIKWKLIEPVNLTPQQDPKSKYNHDFLCLPLISGIKEFANVSLKIISKSKMYS